MKHGILNPWLFIGMYVGLWFSTLIIEPSPIAPLLSFSALALQLWWTWSVVRYLALYVSPADLSIKKALMKINSCLVAVAAVAAVLEVLFATGKMGTPSFFAIQFLAIAVGVLLVLVIFWVASSALCEIERGAPESAVRIVGTFLCFFYLLVGAPFIFGRIQKLSEKVL